MSHPVRILREDPDYLIVAKPTGIAMHDAEQGIIPAIKALTGDNQLYLCHRLDTVTSGLICVARNASAAAIISEQFANKQVQKYYLAITDKKPKKKQGTVSGDMQNRRRGQHILLKSQSNPAVTQFFSGSIAPGLRGIIVRPLTGKTHQIRVALKSLGAPILGDTLYGGTTSDRTYLHAWQLSFWYYDERVTISCPPDEGKLFCSEAFSQWLSQLGSPENMAWPAYSFPPSRSQTVTNET